MTVFLSHPISNRRDLFGRTDSIDQLEKSLSDTERLIIITGLRKVGKTSLIKSVLSDHEYCIFIDTRNTASTENADKNSILNLFHTAINDFLKTNEKLREFNEHLKSITGVKMFGVGVDVDVIKHFDDKLFKIFKELDTWANKKDKTVIIVIDEVQALLRTPEFDITALFASIYDTYTNIKIILTGSEMDLLFKFLGDDDPNAPLNGKPRQEIKLSSLSTEQCIEFLKSGLTKNKLSINEEDEKIIVDAAEKLNSRIGWLTEFGIECVKHKNIREQYIIDIVKKRSQTAKEEFEKFLKYNDKEIYRDIIEFLANLVNQADFVKYFAERHSTKECVDTLKHVGFIIEVEQWHDLDYVLKYAFRSSNYDSKRNKIIKNAEKELSKIN